MSALLATTPTEGLDMAKRGRKPKPRPEDPMDAWGQTKVRKRLILRAKHVAESKGLELQDYLDGLLAPLIDRDYKAYIADEQRKLRDR